MLRSASVFLSFAFFGSGRSLFHIITQKVMSPKEFFSIWAQGGCLGVYLEFCMEVLLIICWVWGPGTFGKFLRGFLKVGIHERPFSAFSPPFLFFFPFLFFLPPPPL